MNCLEATGAFFSRMERNRTFWNVAEWRAMMQNAVESAVMGHNKGLQSGFKANGASFAGMQSK